MDTKLTYDEALEQCRSLGYIGKIDFVFANLAYVWTSDESYCAMIDNSNGTWKVVAEETFICARCGRTQPTKRGIKGDKLSGYALSGQDRKQHCFDCVGKIEREFMIEHGHTILYLTKNRDDNGKFSFPCVRSDNGVLVRYQENYRLVLSDCLGSYIVPIEVSWTGRHNMADEVRFIRFIGPDEKVWSGRQIGRWNDVCHCKRTKITPDHIKD